MSPRLAALIGYDPQRVAEMPPSHQRSLALSALAAGPALVLLGVAAAYGAWLASDVPWLSVAVGVGASFYLLNLLRVAVAGGGVGPQQPLATITTFAPRTVPLLMLALLGAFFAQPLILGALAKEHDPAIEQLRRALGTMHQASVLRLANDEKTAAAAAHSRAEAALVAGRAKLSAREAELRAAQTLGRRTLESAVAEDRRALEAQQAELTRATAALEQVTLRVAELEASEVQPYLRHLARSHFLLRRVQLTWERPLRALLLTLLMVVSMVLPWLASATVARSASRSYEARRWKANRAIIDAAYAEARRAEAAALAQWPTFTGPRLELHEDAPYNTRPRAGAGAFEARHG